MDRVEQLKDIQEEARELFKKKNTDYGDAFANYGPIGVLVRMGDKISRLQSIDKNKIALVNDEKMRDTLIDLHNYSAMAIMLLDKKKKKVPLYKTKSNLTVEIKKVKSTYEEPVKKLEAVVYYD